MGHLDVICQTIMNMPVQPSCTRKSMQALCLFINTIPYLPIWYLANLNILACYFSFSTHLFNSSLKCARMTRPKLNRLFVMVSVCLRMLKTPSKDKDKPNQKCCCAFYHKPTSSKSAVIVVYQKSSLCTPSLGSKMRFSKDVYLQAAQKER